MPERPGGVGLADDVVGDGSPGPQSTQALGEKRVLMIAVTFPDVEPAVPIQMWTIFKFGQGPCWA